MVQVMKCLVMYLSIFFLILILLMFSYLPQLQLQFYVIYCLYFDTECGKIELNGSCDCLSYVLGSGPHFQRIR
jgi:hypothetical protein